MRQTVIRIVCVLGLALVASFAAGANNASPAGPRVRWLRGHDDGILAIAFSPDGKSIVTGSADHSVRVWDSATGAPRLTLTGHRDAVNCVAWSGDGKRIVSGGKDMTVRVWDAQTGDLLSRMARPQDHVHCMAVSADASRVVTGSCDGCVTLWDTVNEKVVWRLATVNRPHAVALSPDAKRVAFGCGLDGDVALGAWQPGKDCFLFVYDAQTGQELNRVELPHQCVQVFWSSDGQRLATACPKGVGLTRVLQFRDADTLNPVSSIEVNAVLNKPFVLSPAFDRVLQQERASVCSLDPATGKQLDRWQTGDNLHAVAISDDGRLGAWGGGGTGNVYTSRDSTDIGDKWSPTADNSGQVFDLTRPFPRPIPLALPDGPPVQGMGSLVTGAAPSRDGETVTAGYWTGTIRQFRTRDGSILRTIVPVDAEATKNLCAIAEAPDGKLLSAVYMTGDLRLYDVESGKETLCIKAPDPKLQWGATAFSPDGKFVFAGFWGGSARGGVWMFDARSGAAVRRFELGPKLIGFMRFTADGTALIVVERGGLGLGIMRDRHAISPHVTAFDVATGKVLRAFDSDTDGILAADVVADHVVALATPRDVRFWNVDTGVHSTAAVFSKRVETLATEPNGKTILAVGDGSRVLRIDPASATVVQELSIPGHTIGGALGRLVFLPDAGPHLLMNGWGLVPVVTE